MSITACVLECILLYARSSEGEEGALAANVWSIFGCACLHHIIVTNMFRKILSPSEPIIMLDQKPK